MATAVLSYEALPQMKFNDFKKAVKEKSQWRKARALVLLFDYKMGSKKTPIVLPLRRPNQLKPLLKQIKADKHPNQKLAAGTLSIGKGEKGPEVVFTMTHGGYKLSAVATKIAPLFKSLLKMDFRAEQGSAADAAAVSTDGPLDEASPTAKAATDENAQNEKAAQKVQLQANAKQVKPLLQKITQQTKLLRSQVVPNIKQQTTSEEDQQQTDHLATLVQEFMTLYKQFPPKAQQKIQPYYQKITEQVQPFLKKIEKALQQTAATIPAEQPSNDQEETTNQAEEIVVKEFQSEEDVEQFLTAATAGITQLLQQMGVAY